MSADYALRYPIGEMLDTLAKPIDYEACVKQIKAFPDELRALVSQLTPQQEAATYRPGSWTVKTLVHHCADSHVHATARVKWALTEDHPHIMGYNEGLTANLPDYDLPLDVTLSLIDGLHARLARLLEQLDAQQSSRSYFHTGHQRSFTITETAAMYAWHGRHHLEHIKLALAS